MKQTYPYRPKESAEAMALIWCALLAFAMAVVSFLN